MIFNNKKIQIKTIKKIFKILKKYSIVKVKIQIMKINKNNSLRINEKFIKIKIKPLIFK
jgi:hypothetical protein